MLLIWTFILFGRNAEGVLSVLEMAIMGLRIILMLSCTQSQVLCVQYVDKILSYKHPRTWFYFVVHVWTTGQTKIAHHIDKIEHLRKLQQKFSCLFQNTHQGKCV